MYILWFSLGVVVEGAVLQLALKRALWQTALFALLINGITHPLAWWAVQSGTLSWLATEISVVIVETALIALAFEIRLHRALLWSLVANVLSAGAGLIMAVVL